MPPQVTSSDFGFLELAAGQAVASRINPGFNLVEAMKKRAAAALGHQARFPSLLITADSIEPLGSFAEAQAQYLHPDPAQVARLVKVLSPVSPHPARRSHSRRSSIHPATHACARTCMLVGVRAPVCTHTHARTRMLMSAG